MRGLIVYISSIRVMNANIFDNTLPLEKIIYIG